MKRIAISMLVDDDTDIFELHDELSFHWGDDADICVYETVEDLIMDENRDPEVGE